MLVSLDYEVKFKNPTPGRPPVLKNQIVFAAGLTGITGPNEAGKSTILEMIRFALFGAASLRAKLDEYLAISTILTVMIRGVTYSVHRTKTSATLSVAGTKMAVGSLPVTAKVTELLGYDLTVFDMANFCGQGEVDRLTKMKPTERKTMVDRVIGLNAMDTATKNAASERQLLQAQLKGLRTAIGMKPSKPTEPKGYRPSADVTGELDLYRPILQQHLQDIAWLNAIPPQPDPCRVTETVEELYALQQQREKAIERRHELERLIGDVSPTEFTEQELDQIILWHELPPYPTYSKIQLDEMLKQNEAARQAEFLRNELAKAPQVTCPSCGTTFRHHNQEPCGRLDVEPSPLTDQEIYAQAQGWQKWQHQQPFQKPAQMLPLDEALRQRRWLSKLDLINAQQSLPIAQDRTADLRIRQEYEAKLSVYSQYKEDEVAACRRRVEENQGIQGLIDRLEFDKEQALAYETRLEVFTEQYKTWEANQAELQRLEQEADEWDRAGKAIKELRTRVKTHLMPSLNRVASQFLGQMTGGQRNQISISEDFVAIRVDGQSVETLSGSAKAVTNLAIRLALGRVLTNSVFSVFMGDELDASMDADRANYTAECLRNLCGSIEQIILVSHKNLDVQHRITLC